MLEYSTHNIVAKLPHIVCVIDTQHMLSAYEIWRISKQAKRHLMAVELWTQKTNVKAHPKAYESHTLIREIRFKETFFFGKL